MVAAPPVARPPPAVEAPPLDATPPVAVEPPMAEDAPALPPTDEVAPPGPVLPPLLSFPPVPPSVFPEFPQPRARSAASAGAIALPARRPFFVMCVRDMVSPVRSIQCAGERILALDSTPERTHCAARSLVGWLRPDHAAAVASCVSVPSPRTARPQSKASVALRSAGFDAPRCHPARPPPQTEFLGGDSDAFYADPPNPES